MATERFLAAAWRKAAFKSGWAAGLAACFALPSCVGPDFALPAAPEIAAFTPDRQPADNSAGGTAQRLEIGNKFPADWWALFHSNAFERAGRTRAARQSEHPGGPGRAACDAGQRLCGGWPALANGGRQLPGHRRIGGQPSLIPAQYPEQLLHAAHGAIHRVLRPRHLERTGGRSRTSKRSRTTSASPTKQRFSR